MSVWNEEKRWAKKLGKKFTTPKPIQGKLSGSIPKLWLASVEGRESDRKDL